MRRRGGGGSGLCHWSQSVEMDLDSTDPKEEERGEDIGM